MDGIPTIAIGKNKNNPISATMYCTTANPKNLYIGAPIAGPIPIPITAAINYHANTVSFVYGYN